MVMYPDVQSKAHAEIANISHHNELSTVDEMESVPYVTALVLELFRWNATAPLGINSTSSTAQTKRCPGVPRYLHEHDIYRDYLIPGGSIVIANQWYGERQPIVIAADVTVGACFEMRISIPILIRSNQSAF